MEQEKTTRLLLRQLKDIQSQADRILTGDDSHDTIESFARYSTELKDYISKNVDSLEIRSYASELPEINHARIKIKLWQYVIWPTSLISMYKNYQAKVKTMDEIHQVKGKYATLELLTKGLIN